VSEPRASRQAETGGFLAQLAPAERAELERRGRRREWGRGEVICREADTSDWVLVLLAGRVKISSNTASGTEVVLEVRGPGSLVGELSAIDRQPRSATVTTMEKATGLVVPYGDFEAFLRSHGGVALLLLRTVAGRLREADRRRIEFGAHDTTGRVAARLVELAERFGQQTPDGVRIALPLTQDELAGWIGASREAVSKALGVLRGQGWIETSRLRVVVHDLEALRELAR
jgi:CRP/FNR family transcriptional regulator, cyclic AMP receptor protein